MANSNLCLCWMVIFIGSCGSPFFPTETNLIPMKKLTFEMAWNPCTIHKRWKCRCFGVCASVHSLRWCIPAQFYLLECSWLFFGVLCIVLQFCIVSVQNIHCHGIIEPNVLPRDDIIFCFAVFLTSNTIFPFRCVLGTHSQCGRIWCSPEMCSGFQNPIS